MLVIKKISAPNKLGEGPHWDVKSQTLYFVDIHEQKVFRFDPNTGTTTYTHFTKGPIGVAVPVKDKTDQLIVACGNDIILATWDGRQNVTDPPYKKVASLDITKNDTRANDGKCDSAGRFWVGTMGNEHDGVFAENQGTLYRIDNKLNAEAVFSPVSISNGLAWNSDNNVMYYIDSLTRQISAFDYDSKSGNISNKKVIFDFEKSNVQGIPDGMTIDTDNNLWVAVYMGHSVLHIDPRTGKLLDTIKMPAENITSVAFGGPDLDTLYVTSAYDGVSDNERKQKPDSGCVFEIKAVGAKGYPANDFVYEK